MKKINKIAALLFALAIIVSAIPATSVKASAPTIIWTQGADGWSYLQGTDIRAKQQDYTLTIEGNGELPDFDYWYLYQRPWDKTSCTTLNIGEGITYIGSYAFYNISSIKYIYLNSSTFINDSTCFEGIASYPIFRIYGDNVTEKQFGTITLTSMDSISRLAQTSWNGACYIMDTVAISEKFQNSTNPTIRNVFYAHQEDAPWNELYNKENGGVVTSICKISTQGISPSYGVSAQNKYQGNACYEAYAAFIGDYNFATTFDITLYNGNQVITKTDTPLQYTLQIPSKYSAIGTTFKLLAIGSGVVYTYDDLDMDSQTITFQTDYPTTSYALIYK
jgi:hypothetical protein